MKRRVMSVLLSVTMLGTMLLGGCGVKNQVSEETTGESAAESMEEESTEAESAETESAEVESAEPDTLKVGLMGTSVKPVGVLVADALGYFTEEGVNIEFEKVSSMNDAYLAVADGDLDVYLFSSTAAATFISQGTTTLRVFGGTAAEGSEIMAKPDCEITLESAESLRGLRIACQMPETGQMVLKNYLIEQGMTYGGEDEDADVTFIYVDDGNTAIQGVVNGEFDLCITNSCLGYYADKFGVKVIGGVKDLVETYPCCRQTCNQTTYEEHFDALVKFETAAIRGYEYYLNNEEETLDILEAYSGEDRDFLRGQVYGTDNYTPMMRLSLDPDQNACVDFYEAMGNIGGIDNSLDIDWASYVVTDVYGTALDILEERVPDNALYAELRSYFEENNTL
ncbi:MAG: ABC transporter substrate-binding protein [Lachnospiraceae bacterium]|nr:ABC transporter substrate-binding protein [Candidatus Equihabitans merdae]